MEKTNGDDEKEDRLSILPVDIIHHIFSFITCKSAVRTSVLSKQWVNIWTTLPYLNFINLPFDSDNHFHRFRLHHQFNLQPSYNNFVRHFFANRNHQSDVLTLKIDLNRFVTDDTIQIVQYAISHNLTQLHILNGNALRFQLFYHLLTTLQLSYCQVNLSDWTLNCLTTLHLENVVFVEEERVLSFDRFINLKELAFVGGRELYTVEEVSIKCHNLSSLTLSYFDCSFDPLRKFVVSAPNMSYFKLCCHGSHLPVLSTGDGFPCLKEVELNIDIDEEDWDRECFFDVEKRKRLVKELIHLFHKFCGAKFLNLSFATIQALSRVPKFSVYQASPYCNLESLNLLHSQPWLDDNLTRSIDHVIEYLLSNSPCAKIFIQDCSNRKFIKYNPEEDTVQRDIHGYHLMKSKKC